MLVGFPVDFSGCGVDLMITVFNYCSVLLRYGLFSVRFGLLSSGFGTMGGCLVGFCGLN